MASILGKVKDMIALIASDLSYVSSATLAGWRTAHSPRATELGSFPDSKTATDEEGFPDRAAIEIETTLGPGSTKKSTISLYRMNWRADISLQTDVSHVSLPKIRILGKLAVPGTGLGALLAVRLDTVTNRPVDAIVAFEGSTEVRDWYQNLTFAEAAWRDARTLVFDALAIEREYASLEVPGLVSNQKFKLGDLNVHFTGQSLGGGLAQYATFDWINVRADSHEALLPRSQDELRELRERWSVSASSGSVRLTTFNAFGAEEGLKWMHRNTPQFLGSTEALLKKNKVEITHYGITNDLVSRLGGAHLGLESARVRVDFRQVSARSTPASVVELPGAQNYLGFVDAHRIEAGFYRGFKNYGATFANPGGKNTLFRPVGDFGRLDLRNAIGVIGSISRFMKWGPEVSEPDAAVRAFIALLAAVGVTYNSDVGLVVDAFAEAQYRAGQWSAGMRDFVRGVKAEEIQRTLVDGTSDGVGKARAALIGIMATNVALGSGPAHVEREVLIGDAQWRKAIRIWLGGGEDARDAATGVLGAVRLSEIDLRESQEERLDRWAVTLAIANPEIFSTLMATRSHTRSNSEGSQVPLERFREFVRAGERGFTIGDVEQFAVAVSRRTGWRHAVQDYLEARVARLGGGSSSAEVTEVAAAELAVGALEWLREIGLAAGQGSESYMRRVLLETTGSLTSLSQRHVARNTSYVGAGSENSTDSPDLADLDGLIFRRVSEILEEAWVRHRESAGSIETLGSELEAALSNGDAAARLLADASMDVALSVPGTRDVFDSGDAPADPVKVLLDEGQSVTLTLELAWEPAGLGQWVGLELAGATAAGVHLAIDGIALELMAADTWRALVLPGQRYAAVTLISSSEISAPTTLAIRAQLLDAEGRPLHEPVERGLVTLKADVDPEIHLTPAPPGALDDLPGDTLIDAQGDPDVWDTIGVQGLLPVNDLGGHDTIRMNAGNDTGFGGRGEDTVSGGSGVDVVAGGDGNDELYGAEVVALIDLIDFGEEDLSAPEAPAGGTGGQGDWVDGGRGDDRVVGSARDDVLLGGAEADRLVAGAGDDTLFGDRTADPFRANGWRIARTLEIGSDPSVATARANFAIAGLLLEDGAAKGGEHGDDWLAGGAGDDWLYGEGGNDLLDGGADDDWLVAGEGDDTAIGGAGSDYLFGDGPESFEFGAVASVDHGADTLHGNDGNDRLHGNGGADLLFGDAGDDLIFGDSGTLDQAYDGMDVAYGGDGADTIHGGGHADEIVGGAGNDTLLGDGFAEIVAGRFHGADDLDGGEGDDVIAGTGGDDHLSGGSGDDYLEGDSFVGIDTLAAEFHGNDRLEGDDGDDTLLGGGRDDVLVGGFGADVLRGDSGQAALTGDDRLYGGLGDDELYGDAGNDVLVGGDGVDYLSGGTGDDRFIFERGDARWVAGEAAESVTDAGGSDTLVFANGILVDDIVLTRNPGGSTLLVRWSDTELLAVENGIDGAIEWFEFGDNERIAFREMMKRRFAESRNESVSSRSATLIGGALDDVLVSDVGGATFDGGLGDDTLTGRRGGNTYHYAVGDGRDTIVGAGDQRGPGGVLVPNRVVFAAGITPDMLTLRVGSFAVQVGSDFDDVIRTDEFDPRRTASRRAIDVFEFADGTQLTYDALLARGFDIDGTDAADTLTGTDTVDRLYGMDGDDFLNSFEGDDLLAGGRGADRAWGGAGNDTYLFGYDYGRDSVEDAGGDADTIELLLGVQLDDLVVSRDERDLFLALNDPDAEAGTAPLDTLRIVDHFAGKAIERFMLYDGAVFTAAQIARRIVGAVSEGQDRWYGSTGDDDVDLLAGSDRGYGFEGDDRVRGGAGVDLLYGGEGADVLHGDGDSDTLDGGDGADTLIGGEGGDTLLAGAGDDVLEGGPGNDSVTGGAGNDTIVVTAGAGGLGDTVSADGKAIGDIDTLAIRGASPDAVRLLREWAPMGERDELIVETVARSAGGRDPVERFATISRAFSAQGGTAAAIDRIVFDDGTVWTLDAMRAQLPGPTDRDDRVGGFTTDDVVDGGRGRDQLGGGAGRDHLLGGRGDDALYGEAGEDTLEGGDGRDTLYGDDDSGPNVTAGADRLFGGADDDALHGGDGDDLLDGGAGRDTLRGGAGSDTYLWSRGDGADTIVDLGGTNDVLRFGPGIRPADVRVARFADFSAGGSVVLVVDDSGAQLRLVGHLSPFGGQIERIEFADGVDGAIGTAWRPAEVAARVGPAARIDALEGTSGDDRFVVDHMRDTVFDLAGEDRGVDTVRASVSFTLPEAIEQLELVGRLNLVGTGNRGDNRIAGTDFDDTLDGMQGHDVLVGGRGDDLYIDNDIGSSPANAGAYVRDEIVEQAGEGVDTIRSNAYHYALPDHVERLEADATLDVSYYDGALRAWVNAPRRWVGNALDNVIDASRAADTNEMRLDGGTGADRLIGHRGNDTFVVDDAGDVVVDDEGGFDTIESSIDWTLSTGVEQLVLTGASAITGRGTDGHDMLDGTRNTTANALVGGRGDDTYRVGAGDTVVEEADAGRDTVVISALSGFSRVVSLADWAHIENLQVADTAGTAQLLGDDGDNVLTGNRSNNTLVGGRGRDALRGGEGADQYVVAQMLGVRRLEAAAIATDTVFDDAPGDSFAIDTLRVGARSLDRVLVSREGGSLVLRFVRPHPDDPSLDVVFEHVEVGGQFGAISGTRIENLQFADGVVVPIASLLDAVTTGTWTSASTRGNAAPVVRAFEAPWRLSPDGTSVLDVRSGWITDADALDTVQVAATLVDGARLPAWLRWEWDPVTRSGRVSADAAAAPVGSHEVWFTASDAFGAGSAAPLTIEVPDRPRELVGGPGITELIGGDADDVLVGAGDVVRLVGGAGDDVYRVSHAGQKVVEAAGGGVDTVWVWNSFAVGVDAHVEVIRGERVDGGGMRAAGSVRDEFFVGTRGRDRVTGHGGFDVMLTGAGDDQVMMASSSGVVLAGAGRDLIALSSARPAFVAPGPGVDRMLTLSAPLIVGFNRGDGVDTYDWGGRIGVLSVGGGIRAEDLHVRALSTWTQLDFGGGDELRLRSVLGPADAADADAAADAGRTVRWLQVVPDAAPGDGADPHADAPAVEVYDFAKLLAAFDLARRADATLERWNAATALAGARVTDWADGTAFGGDLAWQYGRTGSLAAMGLGESRATVADPGFGLTGQPISRGTPDASGLRLV